MIASGSLVLKDVPAHRLEFTLYISLLNVPPMNLLDCKKPICVAYLDL
jgi:hypothetical protein